jgi:uncharacterized protein (DUF305 family)
MCLLRLLPLSLAASLLAAPAFAQSAMGSMPGMPASPQTNAADEAMMAGMDKMNHAMASVPMTGHADQDFVAMMIPHHQGAISMAEVELRYGHDPAMRRLAQDIIQAQRQEIAEMQAWAKAHPAH